VNAPPAAGGGVIQIALPQRGLWIIYEWMFVFGSIWLCENHVDTLGGCRGALLPEDSGNFPWLFRCRKLLTNWPFDTVPTCWNLQERQLLNRVG